MIKSIINRAIQSMSLEDLIRINKKLPDNAQLKNVQLSYDIEVLVDGKTLSSNGVVKRKYNKHQKQRIPATKFPETVTPAKKKSTKVKASPQRLRGEYSTRTADIMSVRRMLSKFETLGSLSPLMKEEMAKFRRMHTANMPRDDRESMLRIFYQAREKYIEMGGDEALKQHYINKKRFTSV